MMLSVIMPNFNGGKYIRDAIESILNQTYGNLELIIVDDGSTDNSVNTIEYFKRTDSRVIFLKNAFTKGPSGARNTALSVAKGEYVGFCDSDDIWKNEKAELHLNHMKETNDSFTFSDSIIIDENNISDGVLFSQTHPPRYKYKSNYVYKSLFFGNYINTSSVIVNRDILTMEKFDEDLIYLEDWLFFIRIAFSQRIAYLKTPLSFYRVHRESTNRDKRGYAIKRIMAYHKLSSEHKDAGFLRRSYLMRGIGLNYLALKRENDAKKYFIKAIYINPISLKGYYYYILLCFGNVREKFIK